MQTRKFRHLHLRHFVHLPHHYHSLENSRTFQNLALKFPGLSRTWKLYPKKSRTFQEHGNPVYCSFVFSEFQSHNPKRKIEHCKLRKRFRFLSFTVGATLLTYFGRIEDISSPADQIMVGMHPQRLCLMPMSAAYDPRVLASETSGRACSLAQKSLISVFHVV